MPHWLPQVRPPTCASEIPRSVVRDAAFLGQAGTPVCATQVSGSVPRAAAASVSWAEGLQRSRGWGGESSAWPPRVKPACSLSSDVDECRRVPTPCAPGRCENTPGSFRCVCGTGFRAGPRGAECLGESPFPPGPRLHSCLDLFSAELLVPARFFASRPTSSSITALRPAQHQLGSTPVLHLTWPCHSLWPSFCANPSSVLTSSALPVLG